jgi:hypothetical protein
MGFAAAVRPMGGGARATVSATLRSMQSALPNPSLPGLDPGITGEGTVGQSASG